MISDLLVYKSKDLVVFNKPSGLAVQPAADGDGDLSTMAMAYTKQNLHLLNRLDRPVSGVVLFAASDRMRHHLIEQMNTNNMQKQYFAVVENRPEFTEKNVSMQLRIDKKVRKSFPHSTAGKEVQMNIRYLSSSDQYHLFEIHPTTGVFHQIRAALADIGHPIKGDVKYGARRKNKDRSIHLHAATYSFPTLHRPENRTEIYAAPKWEDVLWTYFRPYINKITIE